MFLHNKKLMYTVRVDAPNPRFAKLLHEQFGGPNGELAAAMRYFTQGWADDDPARRDMLLDIVGSSRVDLQACKLEYSIVSPK